jgi:hypothetical protein
LPRYICFAFHNSRVQRCRELGRKIRVGDREEAKDETKYVPFHLQVQCRVNPHPMSLGKISFRFHVNPVHTTKRVENTDHEINFIQCTKPSKVKMVNKAGEISRLRDKRQRVCTWSEVPPPVSVDLILS